MICPVCTIAVGTCVGISRWLGVDDTVTGLWVGGLLIIFTILTVDWLTKKRIIFVGRKIITLAAYYALTIFPLCWTGLIGHPDNKMWGLDKLVLGMFIGGAAFSIGVGVNFWLKKKNSGKSFFPFQKVIVPILPLVILSAIFYYLIN